MDRLWRRVDAAFMRPSLLWRKYAVALLACATSWLCTFALARETNVYLPFLSCTGAVLISTVFGGVGPGLLSIGIGLGSVIWIHGLRSIGPLQVSEILSSLIFQLTCVLFGTLYARSCEQAKLQTARLQTREAHLASIFDALPTAMMVLDDDGVICAASRAAG